jgi:hypothetical protein
MMVSGHFAGSQLFFPDPIATQSRRLFAGMMRRIELLPLPAG